MLARVPWHYRGLKKMHQSLLNIQQQLEKVIALLRTAIPSEEPFGNAHGNWTFPGLTRAELIGDPIQLLHQYRAPREASNDAQWVWR
jgi:hypothetical protein